MSELNTKVEIVVSDDAKDFLARLEKIENGRSPNWIPVSEKLPRPGRDIIAAVYYADAWDIWGETGEENIIHLDDNNCVVSVTAVYREWKWWIAPEEEISGTVTHWMPLPIPPKP